MVQNAKGGNVSKEDDLKGVIAVHCCITNTEKQKIHNALEKIGTLDRAL
jgi:hypothetical protein